MLDGMPKVAAVLTDLQVRRLKTPGWHAVGGVAGLLLQIRESSDAALLARSWILRIQNGSKRRVLGLGPYPEVTLSEAREKAKKLSEVARQGTDLLSQKKASKRALIESQAKQKTFQQVAQQYLDSHSSDYSNDKHRKQWESTLKTYVYPIVGNLPVSDISMAQVLEALMQEVIGPDGKPGQFWYCKNETAKRVLGRIKKILDAATVAGYRVGVNPATWSGYLDTQLPSPKRVQSVKHHPSLPYSKIGTFMAVLRSSESVSARAIEFLILTAVRSGSVRQARWEEINLKQKVWTIPAEHTKARQPHRVPLQPQAISLLKKLPRFGDTDIMFPSPKGTGLSDMALSEFMRGMRERGELSVEAVPHGFRSTFRTWAAEQTNFPDEIRKVASGHAVGDAVKEAYQRTDLLGKRRKLMELWADFLDVSPSTRKKTFSSRGGRK
jgi:integrase